MKNPSLFLFDDGNLQMTVDLSKIALMSKRAEGSYWLSTGGQSVTVPAVAAVAILEAWTAFQGKFNPKTDR